MSGQRKASFAMAAEDQGAGPSEPAVTRRLRSSTISRVRAASNAGRQPMLRTDSRIVEGRVESRQIGPAEKIQVDEDPVTGKEMENTLDVLDPAISATNALNNMANNLVFPSLPIPSGLRRRTMTLTSRFGEDAKVAGGETDSGLNADRKDSESDQDNVTWAPLNLVPSGHEELVEGSADKVDQHLSDQAKLTKKQRIKAGLVALGRFAKTPLGFFVCFYAFNVVFWGAAIVFFLAGWIVQDPYQKKRWIEITSQVENGLFCVTGFGFIPKRSWDTYLICRVWYYKRKERKIREQSKDQVEKTADLEASKTVGEPVFLRPDATAAEIAAESQLPALAARRYGKCALRLHKSNGWYRPFDTDTHLEFPAHVMFWICVLFDGNSIFQILLSASMWGYNRFTRPPWQQGTLIPLSFLCGIIGAVLQWRVGEKTKRKKEMIKEILSDRDSIASSQSGDPSVVEADQSNREVTGYTIDEVHEDGEASTADRGPPLKIIMTRPEDRETITMDHPVAKRLPSGLRKNSFGASRRTSVQQANLELPEPTLRRMSTSSAPFNSPTMTRRRSSTVTTRQTFSTSAREAHQSFRDSPERPKDPEESGDGTVTEGSLESGPRLEKPRRSQWRRPAKALGRTIFSAARVLYPLSFLFLVLFAAVAILGAGTDIVIQAFHGEVREQKIVDATIILGSYFSLGLLSIMILLTRYYTVRRALANIPKLYLPTKEHDVPHRVYTLITTEFARSSVIRHLSKPPPAAQPGWGQPGTPLDGTHFATSTKKALSTVAKKAQEIVEGVNGTIPLGANQLLVPILEPTMTAGKYLALLIQLEILPQSALPFAQVFAEAWDRAQFDEGQMTAEEYLDVVKIVAVFVAMMERRRQSLLSERAQGTELPSRQEVSGSPSATSSIRENTVNEHIR